MKFSRTWAIFSIASCFALVLLFVAAPATFASAKQQARAQNNCNLLGYGSTDADSNGQVSILQYRLIAKGEKLVV